MNTSEYTKELFDFIKASPSAFHVAENLATILKNNGYTELFEGEDWNLSLGGKYFVTRNRSAVIAFAVPEKMDTPKFMIAAAHSDSPSFKIKDIPELDGVYTRISTEKYGGSIHDSWFDRPLSVAGRIMVRSENGVTTKLVNIDRDLLIIPHVAIHMQNPNEGIKYNPASDLVPLYGGKDAKGSFMKNVAEAAGVAADDIIAHELFLYNRQEPSLWGSDNEFISAPKLDDLECVYSALTALLASKTAAVSVMYIPDNEEVGSGTKQGAASTFLRDTLSRICDSFGGDLRIAAAKSMLLSADNAHALHPNNPSLADATHRPVMNGGVVIKYNAAQLYTTDALSSAVFREICRRADVPVQVFSNRSDMRGGSTLGNISNTQVSLSAVDIGLAQLAMHSSYETAGERDIAHMINAIKAFYETELDGRDGVVEMKTVR